MLSLSRITLLAARLGGALWTAKALVITARDDSFGTLESIAFVGGLAMLLAAAVLVGRDIGAQRRGIARVALTIAVTVALVAATFVFTELTQPVVRALAPGDNLGLEQEGGILLAGLAWLAIAAAGAPRERRERQVLAA